MSTADIQKKHAQYVLTPWLPQAGLVAPVIDRGEGSFLIDTDGKRYFDLASGLIAVNLGHGHPKVVKAMQEQAAKLGYAAPGLFNEARAELAAELSAMSPWKGEGCRTFFTTAGAEANDDVVRFARTLTGRTKILTAYRSFHGSSGTSITMTGEDRRWHGEHMGAPGIVRFFAPYLYRSPFHAANAEEERGRAIEHLERVLVHENADRVAAIVIEPVVGSNGVITYPEGYLADLRRITEKHGILLVLDEVMTGFGRTGASFAAERYGVVPDAITFAKGVTSAYLPLGGVMLRESLAKTFDDRALPCGHTYSGHPMSVACGLATEREHCQHTSPKPDSDAYGHADSVRDPRRRADEGGHRLLRLAARRHRRRLGAAHAGVPEQDRWPEKLRGLLEDHRLGGCVLGKGHRTQHRRGSHHLRREERQQEVQ